MALTFEKHILARDGKALVYRTTQKGQLRMGISSATQVAAEGLQEEPPNWTWNKMFSYYHLEGAACLGEGGSIMQKERHLQ